MSWSETQLWSQGLLARLVRALFRVARPRNRQLRLAEVLSLGERRFVAADRVRPTALSDRQHAAIDRLAYGNWRA
jgi:hypothetical protein